MVLFNIACVTGRRKGGTEESQNERGREKVPYRDPPASDLHSLHALVFPPQTPATQAMFNRDPSTGFPMTSVNKTVLKWRDARIARARTETF